MMFRNMRFERVVVALTLLLASASVARAGQIEIKVTNNQATGGFAISPVWLGLSDGSFPAFAAGDNLKGSPYQTMAELGSSSALTTAFAGVGPQVTVGPSPRLPGGSSTVILDVADSATNRFLNYASMVVPSNDFFFGNDAAHPLELFNVLGQLIDANGNLAASRTILIFGRQVWDAGTEVDDIGFGPAFIAGANALDHVDANSTAQPVFGGSTDFSGYLNAILGQTTAGGYDISHLISAGDLIATIEITSVPEPSSLTLAGLGGIGLIGVGYHRIRRTAKTSESD